MSNTTQTDMLPVTGSGPMTFALGAIGLISALVGWFLVRLGRKTLWVAPEHGRQAFLLSSYKGAATVGATVRSALAQGVEVFVVVDGPFSQTAAAARKAGATGVLALADNVGKPTALKKCFHHFDLGRYEHVSVIDDDTILEEGFLGYALARFDDDTAVVVGETRGAKGANPWNPIQASMAWAQVRYGWLTRRGQSALNVMTVISGSNSVYTSEFLHEALNQPNDLIVDDTAWMAFLRLEGKGRVRHAPHAVAFTQNVARPDQWFKQQTRWMWGTFQGINKMRSLWSSRFGLCYLGMIVDWLLYVVVFPALLVWAVVANGPWALAVWALGFFAWAVVGAIATRNWRLVPLAPATVLVDYAFRVVLVVSLVKALRQPTVGECRWESPDRQAVA